MLKQIAWNTFKNTGNINTMMELMEVDKAMKLNMQAEGTQTIYGNNKNKRDNTCTK